MTAFASSLVIPAAHAEQKDLFQLLFGGGVKKKKQSGEFPAAPAKPKQRVVAKVTGPSYYDYKVEGLARVDFAKLRALPQPAAFEPSLSGLSIAEAAAGLEGFDLTAEKDIAKGLVDYYAANPSFIWVSGFTANGRAMEAVRVLGDAGSHGLEPDEYAISVPPAAYSVDQTAARMRDLVQFEMTLSARVLRYVRDAQGGRIDPNKLSGYHDFPAKAFDPAAVLATLAHTQQVRTFLESRHPQNAEYQALRVELEALEASEENAIVIDPRLVLKPGQSSAELPNVLAAIARDMDDAFGGEHGPVLARLAESQDYVDELVPVIKAKQELLGLKGDGVIGPRTVAALVGSSKADRLDKVKLALEQIRWLPSDLGSPRVFINQPAYMASYIEGGEAKLTTRVVIGTRANQTSFFYDEIEQVDYNPYWGVPRSILINEMLPRLMGDPGYLDRAGYEVTDSKGRRIPSASINWGAYGANIPYDVRQTPSEANALGELKILFPNKHAIYMHDTPSKSLFDKDVRAFSHGCIRLADPRGMAAAVLGSTRDYVAGKLKQGHSSEKVSRKIPVYVSYFTAWPDLSGKVEYFDDVYERDARLKTAIEKTDAVRVEVSG
ncbi:MAG: L,D-transpeptidase family protein [Rhizobiaceae bacterium]|nr:L,D-transpeptidase family protein [Rhizobiaceae bacterium]